jgi:putative transposase
MLLVQRGVIVSYESVRRRCQKFSQSFADRLRRRHTKPGDTWHLDELFLRINGEQHYLWRAVDQRGVALDILVQGRRNATAAKRFFKRLLHGLKCQPRRIVPDCLRSYRVAHRDIMPDVKHRQSRYLNNRAENSHRPTRQHAQRFLSAHGIIYGHFRLRRHLMQARDYPRARSKAFRIWKQETCAQFTT